MAVTGRALERLLDVNPQEALPHRDVSTVTPHLPGAQITHHGSDAADEIALLRHLFTMRTQSELFFETDVEHTVAAWQGIARHHGRLLYDCHQCKTTWPITDTADACLAGHPITED